jgi:hypothetical protein
MVCVVLDQGCIWRQQHEFPFPSIVRVSSKGTRLSFTGSKYDSEAAFHMKEKERYFMTEQQPQNVQGDQEQQAQDELRPNTTNTSQGAGSGTNVGSGSGENTNKDTRTGLDVGPVPGVNSGTNTTEGINLGYGDTVKTIEEELKEYNPGWKPEQAQQQSTDTAGNVTATQPGSADQSSKTASQGASPTISYVSGAGGGSGSASTQGNTGSGMTPYPASPGTAADTDLPSDQSVGEGTENPSQPNGQ